jgi:hypothetical protein
VIDLHLPDTFRPTHQTGGLPHFPAIDVFGPPGAYVTAPEDCRLVWPHFITWNLAQRVGGWTCYLACDEGTPREHWYFVTHFRSLRDRGHYHKGGVLGLVDSVPRNAWESHIHEGKHAGKFVPAQV